MDNGDEYKDYNLEQYDIDWIVYQQEYYEHK